MRDKTTTLAADLAKTKKEAAEKQNDAQCKIDELENKLKTFGKIKLN